LSPLRTVSDDKQFPIPYPDRTVTTGSTEAPNPPPSGDRLFRPVRNF
jgi:hypothetical protein